MPISIEPEVPVERPRKRQVSDLGLKSSTKKVAKRKLNNGVAKSPSNKSSIKVLEDQIKESQRHYNNIASLITSAKKEAKLGKQDPPAILALCRIFCRLMVEGRLSKSSSSFENETKVLEWLKLRYTDYQRILLDLLAGSDTALQCIALHSGMQLVREEVTNAGASADSVWRTALFSKLLVMLLGCQEANDACGEFSEAYVNAYDDVRHYTFTVLAQALNDAKDSDAASILRSNAVSILSELDPFDINTKQLDKLLVTPSTGSKSIPVSAHRKQGQRAWLAVLSSGLDKDQRKELLQHLTHHVVPWFQNVELLMDFLTDSYNVGGATSLLSLSGLYYLISENNLDYPDFFKKLYSLLDSDLLYSKHRSRFFRLLNTFMSSTHLPAAMVASFMKRLSRLALDAPPAAIVAVVPWIYNLLKSHPTCTFMIHRVPRTADEIETLNEEGMDDPFNMDEQDPMETGAIDSCLWELVTLQSHYHPNVASLARIISEQFTKASYNLEDFLDHSYSSLLDAELGKDLKKTPVVEYDIPKTIFTQASGDDTLMKRMNAVLALRMQ